jgi:hypothetical protein
MSVSFRIASAVLFIAKEKIIGYNLAVNGYKQYVNVR